VRLSLFYGGTFDPIHCGHLAVAAAAQKALHTSIAFLPSADPPHRAPTSASATQRAEMVELAIAGQAGFSCDRRELHRAGKSYSIDTLRSIRAELGASQPIVWLLGMDAFVGLNTWHEWQELFTLCHFVIAQRPGQSLALMPESLQHACATRWLDTPGALQEKPVGSLYILPLALRYESSTAIRKALATRGEPDGFLPQSVAEYIQIHQLYASRV
jgi:nicotinate-nucleotide adenylyltransferase